MSESEIIVLACVTVWLAVLSLAVLLTIRQIAILTVRADNVSSMDMNDDGMQLGLEVPIEVIQELPDLQRTGVVVLMSSTCGPCREVASTMDGLAVADPITVLLTGDEEQRRVVAALLPASVLIVEDPVAARLAELLQIRSSPFAMRISERIVVGKAYLSESRTLERLYGPAPEVGTRNSLTSDLEVVGHVD